MEEGLKVEEMEQERNGYSPEALTERTLRNVADRIRQMDGRYVGDGNAQTSRYSKILHLFHRRQRQLLEMLNKLDPSWHCDSSACNEPSISTVQVETEPEAREEESTIVSCTSNVEVTSRPSLSSSSSLPSWLTKTSVEGV